jgi:hypothetical protein
MRHRQSAVRTDILVSNHGSLCLVKAVSTAAARWIREHTDEGAMWWGGALVVEPRYVVDLLEGMAGDGLNVREGM